MEPILNIAETGAENPVKISIIKREKKKADIPEKRYYTIEEVAGSNWRDGLDEIEDEWE
jgi:hypothetical protein